MDGENRNSSLAAKVVAVSDSYKMISTSGSFCINYRCWRQLLQPITQEERRPCRDDRRWQIAVVSGSDKYSLQPIYFDSFFSERQ